MSLLCGAGLVPESPASGAVQCSTRALITGCHMQMSLWEVVWLAQNPHQHRCAGARAPAVQWRPRRSSGKLPAITQTPSYHCGPVLPSKQAAKFSVSTRTPRWILAAATLFPLHHLLWRKPLPCPPPRRLPWEALLHGLTHGLELSSFLSLTIPLTWEDEHTLAVTFSNEQQQHPQNANIYETKNTAGGHSPPHLQGTGTLLGSPAHSLPKASWQSLKGITKPGIYFHK